MSLVFADYRFDWVRLWFRVKRPGKNHGQECYGPRNISHHYFRPRANLYQLAFCDRSTSSSPQAHRKLNHAHSAWTLQAPCLSGIHTCTLSRILSTIVPYRNTAESAILSSDTLLSHGQLTSPIPPLSGVFSSASLGHEIVCRDD